MFFLWSIAEAWDWLVHVPVLGFLFLILLAWVVFYLVLYLMALHNKLFD